MNAVILRALLPEIVLTLAAVVIYLMGAWGDGRRRFGLAAVAAVVVAATLLALQGGAEVAGGGIHVDALACFGRWLVLGSGALLSLMALRPRGMRAGAEYFGSLLLAVAGAMLAVEAADLVLLFVGLELISIPVYILLYLGRRDAQSQEAAAKYFYLSIAASAITLYGFSFLYGLGHSTDLAAIAQAVADPGRLPAGFEQFGRLAMVLLFAGLGFKITAVPLHFYAPDVYQGTTQANAALLAVVPKAAGFVVLTRLLLVVLAGLDAWGWHAAMAMAVLSMVLGNFMALWQVNVRRLLAYSSIAHTGYLLIGLTVALATAELPPPAAMGEAANAAVGVAAGAVGPSYWNGAAALLFYLAAYAAATLGAFAVLAHLGRVEQPIDSVDELAGLGRMRPLAAGLLAVCLFSLTGIPVLAGFWGKLLLFGSALSVDFGSYGPGSIGLWFLGLAIVGALNAAVAAAYYLRIIATMYFRAPLANIVAEGGRGALVAAVLAVVAVLGIGLYPPGLLSLAERASPAHASVPVHAAAAPVKNQSAAPATPAAAAAAPGSEVRPLAAPAAR